MTASPSTRTSCGQPQEKWGDQGPGLCWLVAFDLPLRPLGSAGLGCRCGSSPFRRPPSVLGARMRPPGGWWVGADVGAGGGTPRAGGCLAGCGEEHVLERRRQGQPFVRGELAPADHRQVGRRCCLVEAPVQEKTGGVCGDQPGGCGELGASGEVADEVCDIEAGGHGLLHRPAGAREVEMSCELVGGGPTAQAAGGGFDDGPEVGGCADEGRASGADQLACAVGEESPAASAIVAFNARRRAGSGWAAPTATAPPAITPVAAAITPVAAAIRAWTRPTRTRSGRSGRWRRVWCTLTSHRSSAVSATRCLA